MFVACHKNMYTNLNKPKKKKAFGILISSAKVHENIEQNSGLTARSACSLNPEL